MFKDVISTFDKTNTCIGGPSIKEFQNITPQCATHDVTGKWRHIKCHLLLGNDIYSCKKCHALHKILHANKVRNERPVKRLRVKLPSTPSKLCAFQKLKMERRIQGYAVNNAKKRITTLQSRLDVLQLQYKNLSDTKIEAEIAKLNLPIAQIF